MLNKLNGNSTDSLRLGYMHFEDIEKKNLHKNEISFFSFS